jgi:hypothetical protein
MSCRYFLVRGLRRLSGYGSPTVSADRPAILRPSNLSETQFVRSLTFDLPRRLVLPENQLQAVFLDLASMLRMRGKRSTRRGGSVVEAAL